jgi:hypothetical protein
MRSSAEADTARVLTGQRLSQVTGYAEQLNPIVNTQILSHVSRLIFLEAR